MRINPYLSFGGQCQAALQFYERYHATFSLVDQTLGAAHADLRFERLSDKGTAA